MTFKQSILKKVLTKRNLKVIHIGVNIPGKLLIMENRVCYIEIVPQNVLTVNCTSSDTEFDKRIAALRSNTDLEILSSTTEILDNFLQ